MDGAHPLLLILLFYFTHDFYKPKISTQYSNFFNKFIIRSDSVNPNKYKGFCLMRHPGFKTSCFIETIINFLLLLCRSLQINFSCNAFRMFPCKIIVDLTFTDYAIKKLLFKVLKLLKPVLNNRWDISKIML